MSAPKWTPGPWIVEGRGPNMKVIFAGLTPGNRLSPCFLADDDQEANAHLIAAAPELYEALCRLIPPEQEFHMRETPGDFHEDWHSALAALAKARGES